MAVGISDEGSERLEGAVIDWIRSNKNDMFSRLGKGNFVGKYIYIYIVFIFLILASSTV